MLKVIISLQSEDPKVCELGIIIIYASSEYPCFFHQFSFWIPRNRIIHSLWVYKDTWEIFGTVISTSYWLNTKVGGGQDSRSRHPGNISLCLHSTLQTTPAQSPYPYIPLGALTPFCLVQSIPGAAAQCLGNRDSPRQSFFLLQNTVQINSKWILIQL